MFEGGKLDKLLTDTRLKVCHVTAEESPKPNFRVNEGLKEDIMNLCNLRKGALPGMPDILTYLGVPDRTSVDRLEA
jgi:hypothetical protein